VEEEAAVSRWQESRRREAGEEEAEEEVMPV